MKIQLLTLFLGFIFLSCSKVTHLEKETKSLKEEVKSISQDVSEVKEATNKLEDKVSTIDLFYFKEDLLGNIFSNSTDLENKIFYAEQYFKILEFNKEDVEHFFKKTIGLYKELKGKNKLEKMSPLNLKAKRNNEIVFYALSRTLDSSKNNSSMYDIMKEALTKLKVGENMDPALEVIITGENKDLSISLLKARFDIIMSEALHLLTSQENMSIENKFQALAFKLSSGKYGKIKLENTFGESNLETQKKINDLLLKALDVKTTLSTLDIEPHLNKTLQSIVNNIDVHKMVIEASKANEYIRFQNYILKLSTK